MPAVADHLDEYTVTADELVTLFDDLSPRMAVAALAVAHVSTTGSWADDGSVTMRAWMRHHLRMSDRDAGTWLRRAGLLGEYDAFADAALDNSLSPSQLTEVEKCARPKYQALLREHQDELAASLTSLTVTETEIACQVWRHHADALVDDRPPAVPDRSMTLVRTDDGAWIGALTLDDAAGLELNTALANAITWDGASDTRTFAQRQADALFDIANYFNTHHTTTKKRRRRAHVTLSVDASTLPVPVAIDQTTGHPIDPAVADTHLCDCTLDVVVRDPDTHAPLAFGRARYTTPVALFGQVAARDGGCRHPGCNRPAAWCHAHHIKHWHRDGHTDYANLALFCARHHHLIHRLGIDLTLHDDGTIDFRWPDGRRATTRPRGAPPRAPALLPAA